VCAGKNPGLTGSILSVNTAQKSMQKQKAAKNLKQLRYNNTINDRGGDDNDGGSTTVAVNLQVVLQQQMTLAIKLSLTQPWRNCMNDKSMLAAIKSEVAVFECRGVCGRILQLVYSYLQSIPRHR